MLAPPPLWGWRTPLWEILDPPLVWDIETKQEYNFDIDGKYDGLKHKSVWNNKVHSLIAKP